MSKLKTNYVGYVRGEKYLKFELLKKIAFKTLNSRHGGGKRPSWKTQPSPFMLSLDSPSKIPDPSQTHLSYGEVVLRKSYSVKKISKNKTKKKSPCQSNSFAGCSTSASQNVRHQTSQKNAKK